MTLTPEREQQLIALIGRVEELERQAKTHLTSVSLDTKDIKFAGKSKYNGLDDFINNTMSSGLISGCTVTDNSNGTVAVTAGYGYIRRTSSEIGELLAFSVPADSSVNCTDDALNYVYVDYNSGAPTISYTTDVTSLDHTSQFVIALVHQEAAHAHIAAAGQHLNDFIHNVYYYLWEVAGKERASGLVISEDASEDRALNMTAGIVYWALQRISVSALDTSTDGDNDEMTLFYRASPSGWTTVASQHVLGNTQYDDGDGTLGSITVNKYGTYWVYVTIDGELYVQYGQGDYTLAQAEAATVPATMGELTNAGIFIAKIIFQQGAANFYNIYLPWTADIGATPATDHGGLAGLGDDDHTQYLLADGTRQLDGNLIIDNTATEALLVRQNADAADVLIVDTTNSDVEVKQFKFVDGGSTVDIIRDEDDMASDDAAALATQQSIKAYVDANGGGNCYVETGSYTGDGATSQAISLSDGSLVVKAVWIHKRVTTHVTQGEDYYTSDTIVDDNASGMTIVGYDGTGGGVNYTAYHVTNRIIALGTGSFTVDDAGADAGPNKNGQVYNYTVWGTH